MSELCYKSQLSVAPEPGPLVTGPMLSTPVWTWGTWLQPLGPLPVGTQGTVVGGEGEDLIPITIYHLYVTCMTPGMNWDPRGTGTPSAKLSFPSTTPVPPLSGLRGLETASGFRSDSQLCLISFSSKITQADRAV